MCVSYDSACLFARTFSFSLIQKCTATLFLSRLEKQSVKSIIIVDTLLIQLYSLHFH